jgi:DNA-binding CsgD family transcriptional regulator
MCFWNDLGVFTLVRHLSPCKQQLRPVAKFAAAHKLSSGAVSQCVRSTTRPRKLTSREKEVLRWVASGKRNREIAIILGISARTVQKHVGSILNKLSVETRGAAAAAWFDQKTGTQT